jgi:hypothetical protein
MAEPIRPPDPADEPGRHVADAPLDADPVDDDAVDERAAPRRDLGEPAAVAAPSRTAPVEPESIGGPDPQAEPEPVDDDASVLPPPAVEPVRAEAVREEPASAEAAREEPARAEAVREEPVRDQPIEPAARTEEAEAVEAHPTTAYPSVPVPPSPYPTEQYGSSASAPATAAVAATPVEQAGPAPVAAPARPAAAPVAPVPAPPPAPPVQQIPVSTATPRRRGNRFAGFAWALLAAGLFQLFYFASLAALTAALSGPASIGPFLAVVLQAKWGVFAWLPVLFLFLLHVLTVLIAGRAGRFFWVVASGVIAVIVYVLSVVLISIVVRGAMPDTNTLAQTFLNPTFILIGVVGREVVLWTGFATGARGVRVRQRDREDREREERDLAARTAATA